MSVRAFLKDDRGSRTLAAEVGVTAAEVVKTINAHTLLGSAEVPSIWLPLEGGGAINLQDVLEFAEET
jgi:hypothetical protein